MKQPPPPIDWPTNPAFAPAPWHPKFKLEEPLHPVQIAGLRRMTAAQKFARLEEMYRLGVSMKAGQLRKQHPDWSEDQIERAARRAIMHAPE